MSGLRKPVNNESWVTHECHANLPPKVGLQTLSCRIFLWGVLVYLPHHRCLIIRSLPFSLLSYFQLVERTYKVQDGIFLEKKQLDVPMLTKLLLYTAVNLKLLIFIDCHKKWNLLYFDVKSIHHTINNLSSYTYIAVYFHLNVIGVHIIDTLRSFKQSLCRHYSHLLKAAWSLKIVVVT